jgi:GNAT superfamily N-acetyltransferase
VEVSIVKANKKQVSSLISLFKNCTAHMISQGIFQWDENYPNASEITANVNNSEVWVAMQGSEIVGTITLNQFESPEYKSIHWSNSSFIVVHRLAVASKHQGKGVARELMDFTENYCFINSIQSIRLDTYSVNNRNLKFYYNRGYEKIGEVYFRGISDPFDCFEKLFK